MDVYPVSNVREYRDTIARPEFVERSRLESRLAAQHRDDDAWTMRGMCWPCGQTVDFVVDRKRARRKGGDVAPRVPRWREGMVCPLCRMNSRKRAMAELVHEVIDGIETGPGNSLPIVYLLEQVTRFFEWCTDVLPAWVIGSEFLGPDRVGGEIIDGVRHEDVGRLSFPDASFDLIVSNDVHEHVPDPVGGLRELARVLKPGATLLMTTPFYPTAATSTTRAVIENGELRELLPPVFHGNPLSSQGSLVFTDFGWDLLNWMRDAGFSTAQVELSWSPEHGHLGRGLSFRAVRG
jgi:SAM-dependent methyltransferase